MQYIRTIVLFVCLCVFSNVIAQISTNEKPVSFDMKSELTVISRSSTPVVTTPKLDMAKIAKEDKEDEEYDMPPRFGYSHIVNYDLNNSGTWYELPNGDKLWQLEVVCPSALSVNFCYDKFWIPEGGKFFVYSKDKKHTIGAFTSKNNKGNKENIRGFATGLVYGDDVMLEYYQPKEVTTDAIISIEYVVHGYRYIRIDAPGYGASGSCMVNINCEEGKDWQYEKRAVALILVNGNRLCTGSLINTTDLSQKPYFLTANHCIKDGKDASGNPNLDWYTFWWDYEEPGCLYSGVNPTPPQNRTTNGATIVANWKIPDFALFRLSEDPKNLAGYTPYYLGWDYYSQSGDSCVCIHHPKGDVKKISTSFSPLTHADYPNYIHEHWYWDVHWDQTINGHGVVCSGSSGSPLLNDIHRIIGHLCRADTIECNNNGSFLYGKFNVSWTGNNIDIDSIHKRLDCWLDSLNTEMLTIEGLLVIPSDSTINTNDKIYGNIIITSTGKLTVYSDIELQDNCQMIVEPGGQLLIDGGKLSNADLVLKPGAILEIKEGAILETRNGFEAPEGVKVIINKGKIM